MDNILDFVSAALPWVAMGLLLAIFFARSGKAKEGKNKPDYGTEGMCLGMCLGTALGTSLGNNTGLGITLGMLLGLVVGSGIKKKKRTISEPLHSLTAVTGTACRKGN